MKQTTYSTLCLLLSGLFILSSQAALSKKTADYVILHATELEGKSVTLDVVGVRPMRMLSPIPDVTFFHAITFDDREDRPGGPILVAVPANQGEKFAEKFGSLNPRSKRVEKMSGILIPSSGSPDRKGKVWMIDYEGLSGAVLANHTHVIIPEEKPEGDSQRPLRPPQP